MNIQQIKKEKGFTIIEVVLVLAIAGLIFLMVFIALPALQRSQRDQQRRNDLSRAQTGIQNFQTNNRNALPPANEMNGKFKTGYLTAGGDSFEDPDGTPYEFTANNANDFVPSTFVSGRIYFTVSGTCDGEMAKTNQGASKIAFQYKLEGGGTSCVNN